MKEQGLNQNHSSGLNTFTRVTHRKKQAKRTIGITIKPYLIEEARNRNLNISRICEQALESILDYVQPQNQTESSLNFLSRGSFPKESRARSSVRLEQQAHNLWVKGSNPFGPIIRLVSFNAQVPQKA